MNGTGRLVWAPCVAGRSKRPVESLIYQYIHHDIIPEGKFEVIKPIYVRLTEKSLLQKWLTGVTQNAHESFHGIVWQHCPKE